MVMFTIAAVLMFPSAAEAGLNRHTAREATRDWVHKDQAEAPDVSRYQIRSCSREVGRKFACCVHEWIAITEDGKPAQVAADYQVVVNYRLHSWLRDVPCH